MEGDDPLPAVVGNVQDSERRFQVARPGMAEPFTADEAGADGVAGPVLTAPATVAGSRGSSMQAATSARNAAASICRAPSRGWI
ncbi:hypothetical protein AGRA3207_002219 [Actinomadura graeca]|uniref:Uncharacterized protein n=1 Tax=Actinomadura graeca TaxID=2750812 RepID=A0ABX8QSL2_9ACTN|nr:hypothetical protein [Actinomadura graeca]QXJ21371.1 hypothetical protein AGRA3207_002219 [Actinomadura graeca]